MRCDLERWMERLVPLVQPSLSYDHPLSPSEDSPRCFPKAALSELKHRDATFLIEPHSEVPAENSHIRQDHRGEK
jgi:hypothetical protein